MRTMGEEGKSTTGEGQRSPWREELRSTHVSHQPHFKDGEGGGSEKVSGFPNSTWGLLAEAGLQSGPTSFFKVLCSILPSLETKAGRESWEVMQTMEKGGRSDRVGSTLHQDVIIVLLTKAFLSKAILPLFGMHVSECTCTCLVNTSQHILRHVNHWASCLCVHTRGYVGAPVCRWMCNKMGACIVCACPYVIVRSYMHVFICTKCGSHPSLIQPG